MKNCFSIACAFLVGSLVASAQLKPVKSFPLWQVRLNKGPFLNAQQVNTNYILALNPDRLLAPFLKEAGIEPKAPYYGSWESRGLGGQTGGHYLSALAQTYAATGHAELKRRLDYMIDWLETCQQKNGNGYVGGVPDGNAMWADLAAGKMEVGNFSLNKKWVPWYNMHKLYAGLVDTWLVTKNEKAKRVLIHLANWCYTVTSGLSDEQMQQMLRCEQGGMNDVMADVAEITGDAKYLKLAERFSDQKILNPLLQKRDELTGLHANTQIPKVSGFMHIGELANNSDWKDAAEFFWQTVVDNRNVSIGGNSVREHFNSVNDFSDLAYSKEGPETCNSHNMLRLSKRLFLDQPQSRFIDYYERTTYNHILSSQHPERGGFVYLTPMRPQHYRIYSSPEQCFWCCVGTGIENHAKYGELIYAHSDKDLYVNLFIPSTLTWQEKGLRLTQETSFPAEEWSVLKLRLDAPQAFALKVRKPSWLRDHQMQVKVNAKEVPVLADGSGYITISRTWKTGDQIALYLPMETRTEPYPDNSSWLSFVHGPIVLAAVTSKNDLVGLVANDGRKAHVPNGPLYPVDEAPVIISNSNKFKPQLKRLSKNEMRFSAANYIYQEKFKSIELVPFYTVHDARYMLYWPVSAENNVTESQKKWAAEERTKYPVETSTLDEVAPGEQQPEVDHNFEGEKTETGVFKDRRWRNTTAWFSYELRNDQKNAGKLRITYYGADKDQTYHLYVNDVLIQRVTLDGSKGEKFADEEYVLPAAITRSFTGKPLKVKFVANEGSPVPNIYYLRLLK
jgi:uncharacterized protein